MMAINPKDEMNRMARLADIDHKAMKTLNETEMKEYRRITAKYEILTAKELKDFGENYQTRFEEARQKLIDQAGSRQWMPKPPPGVADDRFNLRTIDRKAERQVHKEHYAKLQSFEDQRIKDCSDFLGLSSHALELKQRPKRDFQKATDRRMTPDRRQRRSIG